MGYMYKEGQGIEKNKQEAIKWFQKAADKKHVLATYNMGVFYQNGFGVEKSVDKAIEWLKNKREKGKQG